MDLVLYRFFWLLFMARTRLSQKLTPAGVGVLLSFVVSAIASLGSTKSMSHLIAVFSFVLLLLAVVGSRSIRYRFKAARFLPGFGIVGEPFSYQLLIQNLTSQDQKALQLVGDFSHFPSFREFVRVKRRSPIGMRWVKQWRQYVAKMQWAIAMPQTLPLLSAHTKLKAVGEMIPLRRGRLDLESVTLACADPLGLIYLRHAYELPQSICILPRHYQLPEMDLASSIQYRTGEFAIASSMGEALEFRSLRDYRPGDPTNKIHWKSWAKVGRPIVKEQQDEAIVHHALVLDTLLQEPDSDVFEEAVAVAVSFLMQEQTEELLLDLIYQADEVHCLTVGRSPKDRAQALANLATIRPCQDQTFAALMPIIQTRFPQLSGCICILTALDEARCSLLIQLAQYDLPVKILALYDGNIRPDESLFDFLPPNCSVHMISINQVQQDLWWI